MATVLISPKFYAWNSDGKPLAFGKVHTYKAGTGTATRKATFTTKNGDVENANPVILNSDGFASIFLDGSYYIDVDDADDVNIYTDDNVVSQESAEWVHCDQAVYVSVTSFKVTGDTTSNYDFGRQVKIEASGGGFTYGSVNGSVFSGGETTITLSTPTVPVDIVGACASVVGENSFPAAVSSSGQEWVKTEDSTFVSTTSFTVEADLTAVFEVGRRIRVNNDATGYAYTQVVTSVFGGGLTTVTTLDAVVAADIITSSPSIIGQESLPFEVKTRNAATLEGENGAFYRNAGNMNAGVLPLAQVPVVNQSKLGTDSVGLAQMQNDSVGQNELGANSVGQSEIKTATNDFQTNVGQDSFLNIAVPGGSYSLNVFPYSVIASVDFNRYVSILNGGGSPTMRFRNTAGSTQAIGIYGQYITGSPPYHIGGHNIPLFVQAVIENSTKKVVACYVAIDPPWTNQGPHDMHTIGKKQRFMGTWGMQPGDIIRNPAARAYSKGRRAQWDAMTKDEQQVIFSKPWTLDEKNIDMDVKPHLFDMSQFSAKDHTVVMIDPASDLLAELEGYHEDWSAVAGQPDSITQLLSNGDILIGDSVDLIGPKGVEIVNASMR